MASAPPSPLHVGTAPRCARSNGIGRIARTVLAGLAAASVAVLATTAAAVGVGQLVSASVDARSDLRSALGPGRPAWAPPVVDGTEQSAIIARAMPAAVRGPAPDPAATVALAAPKPPEPPVDPAPDPEVTGSIGPAPAAIALAGVEADSRAANAVVQLDKPPSRTGPRLAALTAVDGLRDRRDGDVDLRRTAIYDISAHTVHLPSGERLEAHSGIGRLKDDPGSVHRKNIGATPPNTYKLSLREALFHGVRAIRLTPVNEREMFGRDGMLAHSYLLGPSGQSHGCVAFKDYPKFLRAFLRGDIDRMVVVRRLDKPPTAFARRDVRAGSTTF